MLHTLLPHIRQKKSAAAINNDYCRFILLIIKTRFRTTLMDDDMHKDNEGAVNSNFTTSCHVWSRDKTTTNMGQNGFLILIFLNN